MNTEKNKDTAFVTGVTGLVGSYLTKILLENGHKVYCLARPKKERSAGQRVFDVLDFWDKTTLTQFKDKLLVYEGDITKEDLGLKEKEKKTLQKEINQIFHCAALTDIYLDIESVRKPNVAGTKKILEFATKCSEFKKINHLSTVYVCGNYSGEFYEYDLSLNQQFNTTYEQSKYEAELLINEYRKKGLWVDIYRPSLIIGESNIGKIDNFRNFYNFLRLCKTDVFDRLPIFGGKINIIPVDYAAEEIYLLASKTQKKNKNYHILSTNSLSFEKILSLSGKVMKFKPPILIPENEFKIDEYSPVQRKLLKKAVNVFNFKVKLNSEWTTLRLFEHGFKDTEITEELCETMVKYFYGKRYTNE